MSGLRPCLEEFAGAIEMNLRANDFKGGWHDMTRSQLFKRLAQEVEELANAILMGSETDIYGECMDVASFAMFIADGTKERP